MWPIMQSVTDETSTTFVIQKQKTEALQYYYFDTTWKKINSIKSYQRNDSDIAIEHLSLSGLSHLKNYKLKIKSHSNEDIRNFKTITYKDNYNFKAASCIVDGQPKTLNPIMNQMTSSPTDFFLLIGDNVYIDFDPKKLIKLKHVTPKIIWDRHTQARKAFPLFYLKNLKPILASWDDHDYGKNNGNKFFKYKNTSLNAFKIFFGLKKISSKNYEDGPGLSYTAKFGTQQFIFLDNRYFRDKKGKGSHWGPQQEEWLLNLLNNSTTPSWIINGDQLWGGYHPFESFEGDRPHHFKAIMKKIAQASPHPIAFLTGDRHLSEVMEISETDFKYKTIEITASPLHAKLYPSRWDKNPNPRQIQGIAQTHNYVVIRSKSDDRQMSGEVLSVGPKNKILFKHKFKVSTEQ